MSDTSMTLLEKARDLTDRHSWERFVALYRDRIYVWLRRHSLAHVDAEDLTQDVFTTVLRELPRFEHQGRPGCFRAWLRKITAHRLRHYWRSAEYRPDVHGGTDFQCFLTRMEDGGSTLSAQWNLEHDRYVTEKLLDQVQHEFEPATWKAFHRVVREGEKPAIVAMRMGMTVNAVLIAKSRVLRKLRREAERFV